MKFLQLPSSVLMVRPSKFGFNAQTASTNAFQKEPAASAAVIQEKARDEFNRMVDTLIDQGVDVMVVDDTEVPEKPDAIFPNNWISFHENGIVVLYPMMVENRRAERSNPVIDQVRRQFEVSEIIDLTGYELKNQFLEGTGSVVFDYQNRIAYASRSPRTHQAVLLELCNRLNFRPLFFDAVDEAGLPIYHTNVLMCVGSKFAVICLDAIKKDVDQEKLLKSFGETGHRVVAISYEQLRCFAGNMIEVQTRSGEPVVLLSQSAFNSLLPGQVNAISKYADMIPLSIPTIEQYGGGSVRCMVAGIFNKRVPHNQVS